MKFAWARIVPEEFFSTADVIRLAKLYVYVHTFPEEVVSVHLKEQTDTDFPDSQFPPALASVAFPLAFALGSVKPPKLPTRSTVVGKHESSIPGVEPIPRSVPRAAVSPCAVRALGLASDD